jgi:hypothetical protein
VLVAPRAGNPDTWDENDIFPMLSLDPATALIGIKRFFFISSGLKRD